MTTVAPVELSPLPSLTIIRPQRRWLSKSFRFRLQSFLPGSGALTLRRFSITEAALLLILAFMTSRALGVVRQVLFNMLFGTGIAANAYYAAAYLPETLFDLVAGGALIHAFIPVFLSYEKNHDHGEIWRLTSLVFNILLVALTLLVLIGELFAPAFVANWLVPGYSPAAQALTTNLTRIMLLQPLILGLGTVITAILNSKRQFLLPALSFAIYNVGLIGGLGVSFLVRGVGIYGPTGGILVAAFLQVFVMVPALIKQGARYSFTWQIKHPALREVLLLLIPNVIAVGIASVTPIVDTAFLSFLPDTASLAATRNASMLFALPLALVAQAVGQASMPQLTTLATAQKYVRLRQTFSKVLGASLVFSLLAALFLGLLGRPVIHLLFQHGAFDAHSSSVTYLALLGYAIALPFQALSSLLSLTFYAMKNAVLPLIACAIALLVHIGGLCIFFLLFSASQRILAIPLSVAADGCASTLLLGLLLFTSLRSKVRKDKGMLRLRGLRAHRAAR
ncbi:MAG TPA: murein biosynthesis integral membrane protein MurJ [Ktedonobacteraceae bacterium]